MNDFYDRMASLYHLIFPNWDESIERQAGQLAGIIHDRWGGGARTVLDVSCGIGTQALGLARRGFAVTASDLSAGAVARARDEARRRGLDIQFSVCDMRAGTWRRRWTPFVVPATSCSRGESPVPRQNRVTPFGSIIATPERGRFMGNRGVLHDGEGRILRAWQGKRWIVCLLEFKGRKRAVMAPGHYTEVFFLDEATALASYQERRPRPTGLEVTVLTPPSTLGAIRSGYAPDMLLG